MKRLLGMLLCSVCPAMGSGGENLDWHHVLPDERIENLGVMHGQMVGISSSGTVFLSTNGADVEPVTALGQLEDVIFTNDGVVVFTETTEDYVNYRIEIFQSSDLQTFESVYAAEGDVHWRNGIYNVAGSFVSTYREDGYERMVVVHSEKGDAWAPVLTVEGVHADRVSRTASGDLVIHSQSLLHPWYLTTDGETWTTHNGLIGTIAPIGSAYAGIGSGNSPQYSEDGSNWASVDVVLPPGPRKLKRCGDLVVLIVTYQHIFISTDGLSWETSSLPPPPYAHPYQSELAYHDGFIWARRQLRDPAPGKTIPDWVPRSETFKSVDGLIWESTDWPEDMQDSGIAWESLEEPLPENMEELTSRSRLTEQQSLTADGITLEIKEAPDSSRMALYMGIGGAELQTVDRSWGKQYSFDPPYVTPEKIAYLNGVFLCLNDRGELAIMDPQVVRLGQADPQSSLPLIEDSIEIHWNPVAEASQYRVYRFIEDTGRFEATEIAVTTEERYVDNSPGLVKGKRYYYFVIAENDEGISSLASRSTGSRLWSLSSELGSSGGSGFFDPTRWWRELDWLGFVYFENYPWIWTHSHQWWYLQEEAIGFWSWDTKLGWIWSQRDLYPNFYDADNKHWLFYLKDTSDPRWFYDYTSGAWVNSQEM